MLSYFLDIVEDVTDLTWLDTNAAHVVILCEMERGTVTWHDMHRSDELRSAHAQRQTNQKQNWSRLDSRKPWYGELFQKGN